MIKPVTMYSVVCDRCGKSFVDEFNGIEPWSDECYSWWQISRVPAFYKDRLKDLNMKKYE